MNLMLESGSLNCLLQETRKFPPSAELSANAHIKSLQQYEQMYLRSIEDSDAFWLEQAESLDWFVPPTMACNYAWNTSQRLVHHTWFEDGKINVSLNCLDRHLLTPRKNKVAIIWQGDNEEEQKRSHFPSCIVRYAVLPTC